MGAALRGPDITTFNDNFGNSVVGSPQDHGESIIEFHASNCRVIFGHDVTFHGTVVFHRDNSTFVVGDHSSFRGRATLGLGCRVHFGNRVYCGPDLYLTAAEGVDITLGNDLLIAASCRIRADDSHPLYDGVTGERLNPSRSITVEDHVWLGQEVFLMPGSHVSTGSVVGARSMVTRSRPIPAHSLAFGVPAVVTRSKIHWVRKHLQTTVDISESIVPVFITAPPPKRFSALLSRLKRKVRTATSKSGPARPCP